MSKYKLKDSYEWEYSRRVAFTIEGADYCAEFIMTKHSYEWEVWPISPASYKQLTLNEIVALFNSNEEEIGDVMADLDHKGYLLEVGKYQGKPMDKLLEEANV